jgi:competence protein ComFC
MPKKLPHLMGELFLCRGCLGPIGNGAEAGLCASCWSGLMPLDPLRCERCALFHGGEACPEPVAWSHGDALWDYHGGRPPFGALIVPGIKSGEQGWRRALLGRVHEAPLPSWAGEVSAVVPVPTQTWKRLWRGFDLAEEASRDMAVRLGVPMRRLLRKAWRAPSQAGRTESRRRRLSAKAFALREIGSLEGQTLLLVDDVWTTGTSLLRCAQLLADRGAEVRVLTLFRAT